MGAPQTFTDVQPINQNFSDVQPISAPKKEATKPEQPGYFKRLGQSLDIPTSYEEFKSRLPKTAKDAAYQAVKPALGPVPQMIEGARDYATNAYEGIKSGVREAEEAGTNIGEGQPILPNIGKAAYGYEKAVSSVVPFAGSTVQQAGEDWFNKNYRGALGGMTGAVFQLLPMVDEAREAAGGVGKASAENAAGNIYKALDTPGGKGGQRAANMIRDIDIAKPDLAEIQRETPLTGKGADRFHQLADNIDAKQEAIWKQAHDPQIQRWANEPMNGKQIADEVRRQLPPDAEDASPEETAKANKWLSDVIEKPRTLAQADRLLRNINNDIKGKNFEIYGPKGILARQLAAKAIRVQIDNILVAEGEPGVREFNQRWGALETIKNRAMEKAVQEARAEAKGGSLPDWVKPYVFLHPNWGIISGISGNLSKLRLSPAGRLKSGMKELGRTGLEPPPPPP